MTSGTTASRPPGGLPGLDPSWSRLTVVTDGAGIARTFHVLDTWAGREGDDQPTVTVLCLHGNPTWSYLWRLLLASAPDGWRIIAPDHLGMGYSDRPSEPRRLAERVDDLGRLTDALEVRGPVITVAHDWGGILSMGWAAAHRDQLLGIVLTNTAVHLPAPARGPLLIRLAHRTWLNRMAVRWTPLFVRTTTSLTWPRPARAVRNAFAAPYSTPSRRAAVAEFVRDVPFATGHPSHSEAERIAQEMTTLDVPALLMWGPRDPVFGDLFLRDIQSRLPRAVLQRYERASHLLPEDVPGYAAAVIDWIGATIESPTPPDVKHDVAEQVSALAELEYRASSDDIAVVGIGGESITWAQLHSRVAEVGAGLRAAGVGPGVRVALMVPPSIELTVALYSVWRAGGVIVVADKGLGVRGIGRALRSARLDFIIAEYPGLVAARPMRLPGRRVAVRELPSAVRSALRVEFSFDKLAAAGRAAKAVVDPGEGRPTLEDEAAVLFTSGATGPAKGVLYRQRQVRAQLDLVKLVYGLTGDDRLVAAFAPFALFGPALGIRSAVPDIDVTRPGTLTAADLADAALAVDATVVFASPAALRNVVATSSALTPAHRAALAKVRLVASFGAPIPIRLLDDISALLPAASIHTPYGMTEAFPLTNISLTEIRAAGPGDGVCVGLPLPGVQFAVSPFAPVADGQPFDHIPGVTGEIWVRAAHIRDRYDTLWVLNRAAAAHPGWHRTGDVGFLDADGKLWIQGRLEHVITAAGGTVTPVGVEQRVEAALESSGSGRSVAAVGVGPAGRQQVVVVVTGPGRPLAPADLTDAVRGAAGVQVAAVLVKPALPLDIRHNSKIDRAAVARWAEQVLAGG